MPAIGSLRVELELDDGSFTTKIIRAGTSLQTLESQVNGGIVAVRRLDSGFSEVGSTITKFTLVAALARDAIQNIYTVFGSWGVAILKTAGELERMNVLLGNMSGKLTDIDRAIAGSQATKYLQDLSKSAPFALKDLTDGFTKLKSAGLDPMNGSFKALTDSVAAFGGSSETLQRASVAIQQMAGKGVISMEELRQQLGEAIPNAIPLMARALNQTTAEFVKNVGNGMVLAKPALEAFFAEMERTFGGRGVAMMETYNGQIQVLQNSWQKFQSVTAGQQGDGGFLDHATDAVRKLNAALASPEAANFAIRLGQGLSSAVDGIVGVVGWVYKYRDAIVLATEAFGLFIALHVGKAVFSYMATEIGLLTTNLLLMRNAIVGNTLAAAAFGASSLATGFGAINTVTTTLTASVALLGRGITAMLFSPIATTMALANAIGNGLTPVMTRFGAALAATTTAAGATAFALNALMIAGGVTIGIFLVVEAVKLLVSWYNTLTRDAGAAFDRIKRGATDDDSLKTMTGEAAALEIGITKAILQMQALNTARSGAVAGRRTNVSGEAIGGEGVVPDVAASGAINTKDTNALEEREKVLIAFIKASAERVAQVRELTELTTDRKLAQIGEQAAQDTRTRLASAFLAERAIFEQAQTATATSRANIERMFNEGVIGADAKKKLFSILDLESLTNGLTLYESKLTKFHGELTNEQAVFNTATTAAERTASLSRIEVLRQEITQTEQMREASRNQASALGGGSGGADVKVQQAETLLNNLQTKLAEANAKIEDTGTNVARVNQLIANGNWESFVPADTLARIREFAAKNDEAATAVKTHADAQAAMGRIDNGLAKTAADLQGYIDRINNPALSSAEQAFITFQRGMAAALRDVAAEAIATGNSIAIAAAQARAVVAQASAMAANENLKLTGLLAAGETRDVAANNARIQALPPGKRAAEQISQSRAIFNREQADLRSLMAKYERDPDMAGRADAIGRRLMTNEANQKIIDDSFVAVNGRAAAKGGGSKGGGGAAAKQENAITRMTAQLAELKATQVDGTGEWEKQEAVLIRTHQVGTAYGKQVEELAKKIDLETANVRKAGEAYRAYSDAKNTLTENNAKALQYDTELASRGNSQDAKALVNMQAQFAAQRGKVSATPLPDAATDPEARARVEQQIVDRLKVIDAGATSAYVVAAQQKALAYRESEVQIRNSLAETNSEKRRLLSQTMEEDRRAAADRVRLSGVTGERLKSIEDANAAYFQARTEQIERQTEGATSSMLRSWSHLTDNMDTGFASALNSMTDAFTTFVVTGKADFKSMATSIISEFVKIELKAAASPLLKMAKEYGTNALSSLLTGSSKGTGATTPSSITSGGTSFSTAVPTDGLTISAGLRHSGGLMSESGLTRMLNSSIFNTAPRFHTGIGPHERAAVILQNEGVFTQGQMAAIGNLNHSYAFVERALSSLAESAASSAPAGVAPQISNAGDGKPGGSATPNIVVNLTNQSSQPMAASAGAPKFDGDAWIIDVVIKNMTRPGPMRDAMRGGV